MAVNKLKLKKPIIVDHSWGGAVAIAYAKQFGDEITGAVSHRVAYQGRTLRVV